FQAEDGIRDKLVTGVQTCAHPICRLRLRDRGGALFLGARPRARLGHPGTDGAGRMSVALRWYVVHAYSNFEHRVAESLKERIRRAGLEARFGEILVPTEEVVRSEERRVGKEWRC